MSDEQQTEVTLGTGKILGIFFGFVAVCAVFFGLGYSLGRKSLPVVEASERAVAATTESPTASSKPAELTFYQSVQKPDPEPELTVVEASQEAPKAKTEPGPKAQAKTPAARETVLPGYLVQVAALSKPEDAEALANALRKKQYPVFVRHDSPADRFYHVQLGPFGDRSAAEAMRTKLRRDGYNPILKR